MGGVECCLDDDRHEERTHGDADPCTYYLPKAISGEPMLIEEQPGRFRVVCRRGIGFRIGRRLEARDPRNRFARAEDLIIGHDEGDGWILVLEHSAFKVEEAHQSFASAQPLPADHGSAFGARAGSKPYGTEPLVPALPARELAKAPASSPSPFVMPGRKRALLIGCNYRGSMCALSGCHEDVRRMRTLLTGSLGFALQDIETLTDSAGAAIEPTRANILSAAKRMSSAARMGDLLFFHFSGHGAQVDDPSGAEEDGLNEVILPCDWKRGGMITDDELNAALIEPLPSGCHMVALMDCCHAGTGLDLAFSCEDGRRWREDVNPLHVRADVVLFSGCEDWDTSAEQRPWFSQASGVMTEAFIACSCQQKHTYASLLQAIGKHISWKGHGQRPQLSASQRFELSRPFSLEAGAAAMNANEKLGRTINKRFHPQRRMYGPLRDELTNMGFGFALGYVVADSMTYAAAGGASAAYGGSDMIVADESGVSVGDLADAADCVVA